MNNTALAGMKAFVAGATGEVGKGAALALAKAGAQVTIAGRNKSKLETIQSDNADLNIDVIVADYSTVSGAKQLDDTLGDTQFDVTVVSSGPWWPVYQLSTTDDWTVFGKSLNANVETHMLLYRVLAPRTKYQFVTVNGAAAKGVAQTGLTGVAAYAVEGFAKAAYAECEANRDLPQFTHAMISSSVGHGHIRGDTNDPEDFGRVFVAMALGKHNTDKQSGLILIDDAMHQTLTKDL
ncbi:short-chain alcohol dehydrogenase [Nitzschia inconspicua]|uniref:Short-chain alcohol dehydrogenase n=1 Tax=Nitzschia inconspicua TaxID=303405 RepID=A0A9K3KTH8_9STRA|nr:short-chain alcohol dehydrogenase [Nitzschia inconspicua]